MKIMAAFLKYDYGIKERGDSLEKTAFLPALQQVCGNVLDLKGANYNANRDCYHI